MHRLLFVSCQGCQFHCLSFSEGRSSLRLGWTGKYEEIQHPLFKALLVCSLDVSSLIHLAAHDSVGNDNSALHHSRFNRFRTQLISFQFYLSGILDCNSPSPSRTATKAFVAYLISQRAVHGVCKVRGRPNRFGEYAATRDIRTKQPQRVLPLGVVLLTRCERTGSIEFRLSFERSVTISKIECVNPDAKQAAAAARPSRAI